MAVNPVSLAQTLRPWRNAGVTHILPDPELAGKAEEWIEDVLHAASSGNAPQGSSSAAPSSSAPRSAENFPQRPLPSERREAAPRHTPAGGKPAGTSHASGRAASSANSQTPATAGNAASSPSPAALPFDQLPPAWRALGEKLRPAPIVWTYAALGDDLAGRGDKERSDKLKALIAAMKLPRGTSAFWPLQLPEDASAEHGAACFEGGLRVVAPKIVVVIGEESLSPALGLNLSRPFTQQLVRGRVYCLLPSFSAMRSQQEFEKACGYLRSALAPFALYLGGTE